MYRGIEVLRMLPDRAGRGGTKFGYHSFQQTPLNDTRETLNVHVWQDSWRSDIASTSVVTGNNFDDDYGITTDNAYALALHGYYSFSKSDPSAGPRTSILGHTVQPSYGAHIWDYTNYTNGTYIPGWVWRGTTNIVCQASQAYPAVFVNIGDRCFIATGEAEGRIYDNSMSTDFPNTGPGYVYTIGIGAPTANPVVSAADVANLTAVWVRTGSRFISHPDPYGGLSTAVAPGADTLRLTADGVTWSGANGFDITKKTDSFNAQGLTLTLLHGTNIAEIDQTALGTELLLNAEFTTTLANWTVGANWSWSTAGALHAAGSTATLVQNVVVVAGRSYRIAFDILGSTAGGVGITLGAAILDDEGATTFTAGRPFGVAITPVASGALALTITPTNNFNGRLDYVRLCEGPNWPPDNSWVGLTITANGTEFMVMNSGTDTTIADTPALLMQEQVLLTNTRGGVYSYSEDLTGVPFTLSGVRWTMTRAASPVTWSGGATAATTVPGTMFDTGGGLTWDNVPPSYAYAWYDPITGHVSNISPVFSPPATAATDKGVRIPVGPGSISYPPNTSSIGGTRWTHILFFRTLMDGGSTLFPIGSLSPTVTDPNDPYGFHWNPEWKGLPNADIPTIPPASDVYWYDDARDSTLLVSGALRAPQFTNGKPTYTNEGETVTLFPSHMAYWDGRLWMAATQDPAALHYSCDRVQCPFGIPEESFPDTNVLRIPASDGAVRGMRLIGESLLVTTEKWAYTVVGNNEANYRLVRISTRMAGVGDYQMDEFVSDVEGQTTLVVFVGTDSKVYAMPLGGQAVWISKEIQTYLDDASLFYRVRYVLTRVHCMSVGGRRMVLLYIPSSSGGAGKTFIYDFDQKIWTQHTLKNDNSTAKAGDGTAWASIATTEDHVAEIFATENMDLTPPVSPNPLVKVRRWFNNVVTTPIPSGYVRTFPLTFDGKKTRKRLHFVRIYVNNQSFTSVDLGTGVTKYGWRISVARDSAPPGTPVAFTGEYDPAYGMLAGGAPVDASGASERIATDAQIAGDTGPLLAYTMDVTIHFPDQTDRIYQLYAIDIAYSTLSEEQVDI